MKIGLIVVCSITTCTVNYPENWVVSSTLILIWNNICRVHTTRINVLYVQRPNGKCVAAKIKKVLSFAFSVKTLYDDSQTVYMRRDIIKKEKQKNPTWISRRGKIFNHFCQLKIIITCHYYIWYCNSTLWRIGHGCNYVEFRYNFIPQFLYIRVNLCVSCPEIKLLKLLYETKYYFKSSAISMT